MSNVFFCPIGFSSNIGRGGEPPKFQSLSINQFKFTIEINQTNALVIISRQQLQMKQRVLSANPTNSQHSLPRPRRLQASSTEYSQPNLRDYSKSSKGRSRPSFVRKSKPYAKGYTKEPEQIMEQNLNLKSFINNLQSQLALQRNRLEMNKKKNEKVTKQINRQFQKQLYYSGKNPSSYLVSGVKSQYQNIKALYEQKSCELDAVLKCTEYTNIEEMQVYIETLEAQNSNLVQQLQQYNALKDSYGQMYSQDLQVSSNPKIYRSYQRSDKIRTELSEENSELSSKNVEVLMGQLVEEKGNLNRARTLVERYSQKFDIVCKERDELVKKIDFLEKLIIEKDNNEHEARRQLKKVERQKFAYEADLFKISQQLRQNEADFREKFHNLEERQLKKYEIERQIFNTSLKEKNEYIGKLQKQVRSLSAMLSYWKPLDENDDPKDSVRQSSPKSRDVKEYLKEQRMSNRMRIPSDHFGKESAISEHHSMTGGQYIMRANTELERSFLGFKEDDGLFKRTTTNNRSNSLQNAINAIKEKPRKECSKKYNEHAKKSRKVDLNDIKQIGDLIRYRLIGHNVGIEEVKQLFDKAVNKNQDEEEYQDEYINMKTLKGMLRKHPFDLNETEATLVSRYVVEDSPNEYVYWDEENQIYLGVAKSIMRAFVGDFQLSDKEKNLADWTKIKNVYLTNIMTALKTLHPKGKIPLQKFIELITGLGIEMEDKLRDWIIGFLVINSLSLEELNYEVIEKL